MGQRIPEKEIVNFQFVDLKQNPVPYRAVMCFGAWLLIFFAKGAVSNEACISRKALGCLVYVIIIKETPRDRTVSGRFGREQTNEMNARIL